MAERAPDPALEASTNRWMTAGLVIMVLMALAFPLYRITEPANRGAARESHRASLAQQGESIYQLNCAACHGVSGEGGVGPALNSKQFLTAANDEQVGLLVAVGVPGTQMSAYALDFGGPLTSEQIDAVVTFLRSLEPDAPDVPDWRSPGASAGG